MAAALAISAVSAIPASAHQVGVGLHDWGAGATSSDHLFVSACDGKEDGRGIRTEYTTVNHPNRSTADHVGDANGRPAPCGTERSWDGSSITGIRVCARNSSSGATIECTTWIPVT